MVQKTFIYKLMDATIRQWWLLAFILLLQLIPPYASHSYSLSDWGTVNAYILTHPIKSSFSGMYLIFQITPLILLIAILILRLKITRLFSLYVALSYTIIAFLQSFSISDLYGYAVCTANVLTFLTLAGFWVWEAIFPKNEFEFQRVPVWKYWPFLLALLAFWEPVHPLSLTPDFNPIYLLTSGSGLSFCMVTPLYLSVLAFFFPQVNKTVFIATSVTGFFMSLGNFMLEFGMVPAYGWIGILHIPLFILSSYGILISFGEIVGQVKKTAMVKS